MNVSIRQLKEHLAEYLRRVEQGEEVTITRRGKAVGRIVPPAEAEAVRSEVTAHLDRLPWIRPGRGGKPRGARNPVSWEPGEKTLAEMVVEDRG